MQPLDWVILFLLMCGVALGVSFIAHMLMRTIAELAFYMTHGECAYAACGVF